MFPSPARETVEHAFWSSIGIVILVAAWEVGGRTGYLPVRYTSTPSDILATGYRMTVSGTLIHDTVVTLRAFMIGMLVAIAIGIPIGLLAGWYRRFQYAAEPYLSALYATPSLALLPLLVLWFGLGGRSTTALVIISALFPIAINVLYGVKTVDPGLVKMARSFGASQTRVFRSVILPATVPFIASGLQLGIARGLIGVIVGEMYAASDGGLGHLIAVAGSTVAVSQMFVGVVVITILGIVLMGAMSSLENRLQHWKVKAI
jgi:NitT/TauT family transport system permease protein